MVGGKKEVRWIHIVRLGLFLLLFWDLSENNSFLQSWLLRCPNDRHSDQDLTVDSADAG